MFEALTVFEQRSGVRGADLLSILEVAKYFLSTSVSYKKKFTGKLIL